VPKPEPQTEPVNQAAAKRQIIYTATMQVTVHDVEHAVAEAEALPERLGGWLHARTDYQLVLRIPAEKLEQAMATIAELGVVDYRLLEALDVTAQYTDLESRIRTLEEMQTQLKALLEQAKTVEQALEIRKALDQITLELELARTQMRELSKSIAFSTLILRFVEQGPAVSVPTSNDPFGWVDELGVEITEYR
jgi:citrate lyase beta subunit